VGIPARWRNALRAGWALNSSREYGYSISSEDGIRAAVNLEGVTPSLGADAEALTITGDVRAYLPGFCAHHVVAMRLGAASSTGDTAMQRTFSLGGSAASSGPFAVGKRVVGLLRGLPPDDRIGTAVLVANLDYRFPIARVERGIRTWPFFLRDVHGAVFTDVGSAGSALDDLPATAWSVGAEVASRITLGYTWNLNVAAGASWVHDPARPDQPARFAAFVRTGYAF
jgi:outer membrane protein assembly factor BamA